MSDIGTLAFGDVGAVRIQHSTPLAIRWARTPYGEVKLQAAYRWEQGTSGGIDWRDVETVEVAG